MARPRDPYEVPLTDASRTALAILLCDEVQSGLDARSSTDVEVDYWHSLYEQARTRGSRTTPWPDAADLTSYLSTHNVDALHARLVRTVLGVDPIWTVEGWGAAAERAPFVEEFTQWKAEEGRLQNTIDRLALISLIEPRGLLEVYEGTTERVRRQTIRARVSRDPMTGGRIVTDGDVQLERTETGDLIPADPEEDGQEETVDRHERVRTGPVERIIPYRDSLILPAHARDREDIRGYGKRLWKRYIDLTRQAETGLYDAETVTRMTPTDDREASAALTRSGTTVTSSDPIFAEKELWELVLLLDVNAFLEARQLPGLGKAYDGERWYLFTVHLGTQGLLRMQHDDMERSRFIPVILFPRPDRVTEGFSFVGHKLITTIEEHTAWRNMAADRAALVAQAPIKRQTGALWDPDVVPWGPKSIIDVRQMNEIEPMVVPDVTAPMMTHIQMMERTAERLSGVNDVASGSVSQETRTLGEVQMATEQSFVRMDLIVRRFQEAMEELGALRHEMWRRALSEQDGGLEVPPSMVDHLEGRGVSSIDRYLPDGKATAALLEGAYRFRPHGSVETADPAKRRQDLIQFLQALPLLAQTFPGLGPMLMNPLAGRAMLREVLRAFRVENQRPFLGAPEEVLAPAPGGDILSQLLGGQQPPGMPMMPAPGGMPMMPPAMSVPPGEER